jgi:hypothetical protein
MSLAIWEPRTPGARLTIACAQGRRLPSEGREFHDFKPVGVASYLDSFALSTVIAPASVSP